MTLETPAPRRRWKLMTATLVVLGVAGVLAVTQNWLTTGLAMVLGTATVAVQWFCIAPPGVEDSDLH